MEKKILEKIYNELKTQAKVSMSNGANRDVVDYWDNLASELKPLLTPLPDNNGVKDGFEEWLEKRVDYKTTVESAEIETMRMAYSSCLSEYRNFSPPAKVEVDLHSKGLSILNSIWTKVNERLKEKDYPELLLSGDEEEEILSNAFNLPAKVEVSDEEIALDFGCMANEWANNPNFSMKETVAKLRHLLSKK